MGKDAKNLAKNYSIILVSIIQNIGSRIGQLCAMKEGVAVKVEISTLVVVVVVICFIVYTIILCAMLRSGTRSTRAIGEKVDAEPRFQHENQSNAFNGDTSRAYEPSHEKLLNVALLHLRCLQVSQICSQVKTDEEKRKLSHIIYDCIAKEIEAYPEVAQPYEALMMEFKKNK
ncbi:hypothetical protein TSMEX_011479 [Taenia solium]|eukprot:TsM_000906900 transcript=TsM_000906900 gene=TsM_000906900